MWLPEVGDWSWGKWKKGIKRNKLSDIRYIITSGIMYNMINIFSMAVCYI